MTIHEQIKEDWCLYDAAGNPFGRWMTPGDEADFRILLRRIYGETYSYKDFYRPGKYAELLRGGLLEAFGMFSKDGALIGHTAFLKKDTGNEFTESAMSLRPLVRELTREKESAVWKFLMEHCASRYAFIHQNTTTLHKLAQRYAMNHMKAVFAGFIYSYTEHETLTGVPDAAPIMHAMSMTTNLDTAKPGSGLDLPDDEWGRWLAGIYSGIMPGAAVRFIETERKPGPWSFAGLEDNPALSMKRYLVTREGTSGRFDARINLVHLPCDDLLSLFHGFTLAGFLPVGLRVNRRRPTEIVMQKFEIPAGEIVESLRSCRIFNAGDGEMLENWGALCLKTL